MTDSECGKSTRRNQQIADIEGVRRVTRFNETTLRVVLDPLAESDVCRKVNAIIGHTGTIGWAGKKTGVVVDYPWEAKDD